MIAMVPRIEGLRRCAAKAVLSVLVVCGLGTLLLVNTPGTSPLTSVWRPGRAGLRHVGVLLDGAISHYDVTRDLQGYQQLAGSATPPDEGIVIRNAPSGTTTEDEEQLLPNDRRERKTCEPKQHIMFLKTHKCASSSIQNIFIRYGVLHNLTFALPGAGNYLGNPAHFKARMIPRYLLWPTGVADIFAVHTRLNPSEHRKVLHPDTVFITVVRDPAIMFESLYNYFRLSSFYKVSFKSYLKLPLKKQLSFPRAHGGRFGYNMMLFDMGVDVHSNITAVDVRRAIDQADELFNLVMIAEEMDESLILLKDLLCWDYSDIIFFTKNARREEVKPEMSVSMTEKSRELNSGDVLLYEHFLAKHQQAVLRYGEKRMADEVGLLKTLREEFFEDCGTKVVNGYNTSGIFKEYSSQVNGYVLDKNSDINCVLLTMPELQLINRLRETQRLRVNRWQELKIQERRREIFEQYDYDYTFRNRTLTENESTTDNLSDEFVKYALNET